MTYTPLVKKPEAKAKIWRYMDFAKFLSVLDMSALFFCQANKLIDKYEGSWLVATDAVREDIPLGFLKDFYDNPRGPRSYTAINCWHMNDEESAGMWNLYSNNNQGIVIQSTVEKLEGSMKLPPVHQLFMGQVNYDPLEVKAYDPRFSTHFLFFYKRKTYAHEREFRVTIVPQNLEALNEQGGVYVKVDLDLLIEKIYIDPSAVTWFSKLTRSIATEKYYIAPNKIMQSQLHDTPLY